MNFYNAQKQFKENLDLFGNSRTEPEKYNLYAGLLNLVKGLSDLQENIEDIQKRLRNIEQRQ